jgi:hypothetical protein
MVPFHSTGDPRHHGGAVVVGESHLEETAAQRLENDALDANQSLYVILKIWLVRLVPGLRRRPNNLSRALVHQAIIHVLKDGVIGRWLVDS